MSWIELFKNGLALFITGLSILVILTTVFDLRKDMGLVYKTYLRSGFLSYVRAFLIFCITVLVGVAVYTYSPNFLRFGWGQLLFSDSSNWGVAQPFEVANQAAEKANSFQDKLIEETPETAQTPPQITIPEGAEKNKIDPPSPSQLNPLQLLLSRINFQWIFIPAVWIVLILVLPAWAKWEEEVFRKGIHTWPGIALNSVKFGLIHLIMGIPICWGLSLSVPGFLFACRYKYIYHRHLKKFSDEPAAQTAGVLASTADHAIYNAILITLLTATFLI